MYGRALCLYATEQRHRPGGGDGRPDLEFEPIDPEDGTDLWDYGTPGERCYTLWIWHSQGEARGRLQIDLAQAGSYALDDIGVEEIEFAAPCNQRFRFRAYTPEMLLAAKLSWLVRNLKSKVSSNGQTLEWSGEPKDLFDAHLLLTKANLRPDLLQKSLLAVGVEDKLDWGKLETLLDADSTEMADIDFPNWEEFRGRHQEVITCGPAEMLQTVVARLIPALGDFRQHLSFLRDINTEPNNEIRYLIYADWLEERGDPRARFLRLFIEWTCRQNESGIVGRVWSVLTNMLVPKQDMGPTREALIAAMRSAPAPWLHQLFGGVERFRQVTQRIGVEGASGVGLT
jgi:uncharacterized protein (TIGR02996 family)